jgi:hypothetical protein
MRDCITASNDRAGSVDRSNHYFEAEIKGASVVSTVLSYHIGACCRHYHIIEQQVIRATCGHLEEDG